MKTPEVKDGDRKISWGQTSGTQSQGTGDDDEEL